VKTPVPEPNSITTEAFDSSAVSVINSASPSELFAIAPVCEGHSKNCLRNRMEFIANRIIHFMSGKSKKRVKSKIAAGDYGIGGIAKVIVLAGDKWGELTELVYDSGHFFDSVIYFLFGVVSAQAESNRAVGGSEGYAHRP